MMGKCTRCDAPLDKKAAMVSVTAISTPGRADWRLCGPCGLGLTTWYQVRKGEFLQAGGEKDNLALYDLQDQLARGGSTPSTDGEKLEAIRSLRRVNSELLHACRMALDACGRYPQILDVLRAAIKGALR